jgi:hypothetical protein
VNTAERHAPSASCVTVANDVAYADFLMNLAKALSFWRKPSGY